MVAILPFMVYQLAGFGTLDYIVTRPVNWAINIGILSLIIASYIANREGAYGMEKRLGSTLVVAMALTVLYGVLKLKQMQAVYDAHARQKRPRWQRKANFPHTSRTGFVPQQYQLCP